MTEYDSPWKEALDEFFEFFLKLCFPEIHIAVDWNIPPRMLDKELQQIAPISLVRSLYERGWNADRVRKLFRLVDWIMDLPNELEMDFRDNLEALEREKNMPYITSIERIALQQGIEKGIEQGIEQGIETGVLVGKIQMLQQLLGEPEMSRQELASKPISEQQQLLELLQQRVRDRRNTGTK